MRWPGGASGHGGGRSPGGKLGRAGVAAERGADLHRHEQRGVAALPRQLGGEGRQRRRLADLPRGVDDEVRLLLDEVADLRDAPQGREHVVDLGSAGAGRVEAAPHVPPL